MTIQAFINTLAPTVPMLPLSHTTYWEHFLDSVRANALRANSPCPIDAKKPVVYLFYGLPLYELQNTEPGKIPSYKAASRPVGFLFRHEIANGLEADIYPFDTGALRGGFYQNLLGDPATVDLREYRIESTSGIEGAAKLVTAFYSGSNREYVWGNVGKVPPTAPKCASSVHRLYLSRGLRADSRKRGIEVLLGLDIPLQNNLCAMIVPERLFARERALNAALNSFAEGVPEIVRYPDFEPYDPGKDCGLLVDRALEFLRQNRLID